MTNEEAIEFLKIIDSRYPSSLESTFNDECERIALNMAIKALEYDAKVKRYGSELAMAYAEKKHDEKYLKELEEREKGGAE